MKYPRTSKKTLPEFPQKEEIFSYFSNSLTSLSKVFVAVSGGPDSMFVYYLLLEFFHIKKWAFSNIFIIHINHSTRPTTQDDEQFVRSHCLWWTLLVSTYTWTSKTEYALRKARRGYIDKAIIHHTHTSDEVVLLTWHNLTDRVETTFLHMLRGSGIRGIQNMSITEPTHTGVRSWISSKTSPRSYIILRPLLPFPKSSLEELMHIYGYSYCVDPTNFWTKSSRRNIIRNTIFPQLFSWSTSGKGDRFRASRQKLYDFLDETTSARVSPSITYLSPSVYRWQIEKYLVFSKPNSISELTHILQEIDNWQPLSEQFLQIFYKFLTERKSWRVCIGKRTWWLYRWHVYGFSTPTPFRTTPLKPLPLSKSHHLHYEWVDRDLGEFFYQWCIVRFPLPGDVRKWKRLKKRFLNHHIPPFRRNYIPVLVDKNKVIALFPFEKLIGKNW